MPKTLRELHDQADKFIVARNHEAVRVERWVPVIDLITVARAAIVAEQPDLVITALERALQATRNPPLFEGKP